MLEYQLRYIENCQKMLELSDIYSSFDRDFVKWLQSEKTNQEELKRCREENTKILNTCLFPTLDNIYNASEEELAELESFADALMDWRKNLDCGVYILIHQALLSRARVHKEREKIIQECYKVGMGIYYQNRSIETMDFKVTSPFYFRGRVLFTEASSYLKYFESFADDATKGYIIRSLANIAICTKNPREKIAASSKVLKVIQDPYYVEQAPSLPWKTFLRGSYQQMSANRSVLSRGGLSVDELSEVLEACEVVFKPEEGVESPNVRWLWPYYEMQYSCGFTDLKTTLARMEELIVNAEEDSYDESSLYANIQLPIYYGKLLYENPSFGHKPEYLAFLKTAYEKMMKTVMNIPASHMDDYFFYTIGLIFAHYYEAEGVESYKSVITKLVQRLSGSFYIRKQKVADILGYYAQEIMEADPSYFDDIEFIQKIRDPKEKKEAAVSYARECGLYYDIGLIIMHFEKNQGFRPLLENEEEIYQLHTICAYELLRSRKSTEKYAEVALGHHRWYNGAEGYPDSVERSTSSYRMMSDLVAVADALVDNYDGDYKQCVDQIIAKEHTQYSPVVTSYLNERSLAVTLERILSGDETIYYLNLYQLLDAKEQPL